MKNSGKGERSLVAEWFIRAMGAVWLISFCDLNLQLGGLFCSEGLIPVREYADRIHGNARLNLFEKIIECPSIFLFLPHDGVLRLLCLGGVIFSLGLLTGYRSRICFAVLFVIYASFVNVGQELYSFQWDSLLLETTFLAILLPDSGRFFTNKRGADGVTSWLFLWLLLRLYIESGVAKLFWGPESWATLQAMSHYYETAPLPTPLGYVMHFLPQGWHRLETGATLVIEILLPALFLGGKHSRRLAFVLFTFFQSAIILTANYGVFNYTTLCLHLFLLKDEDVRDFLNVIPLLRKRYSWHQPHPVPSPKWIYPLGAVIVTFSIIEFLMLAGGRGIHLTVVGKIERYTGATRIASRYHLFGPIDPLRYELVIEATSDGEHWKEYFFRWKADDLFKPPVFVAPFHPRVDFRLWFERYPVRWDVPFPYPDISAHPGIFSGYLGRLLWQCLQKPERARRHFLTMPLDTAPPRALRVAYYHYNMARGTRQDGIKQYWRRTLLGYVYIDPLLTDNGKPVVVRGRTIARNRLSN